MCVFCDIVSKKLKSYIVYENDKVIAFLVNDLILMWTYIINSKESLFRYR